MELLLLRPHQPSSYCVIRQSWVRLAGRQAYKPLTTVEDNDVPVFARPIHLVRLSNLVLDLELEDSVALAFTRSFWYTEISFQNVIMIFIYSDSCYFKMSSFVCTVLVDNST